MDKRTAKRIACEFTASIIVPWDCSEDAKPFLEDGYSESEAAIIVSALRELADELSRRSGKAPDPQPTNEVTQLSLLPGG